MSVATEITRLQNAKADLKASINAKTDSQHQIDDETIDEYADFVDSIQTGGGQPNLQNKSVEITTNTTTNITADSGYDGLGEVEVITSVSGGDTPAVGTVFSDWDSSGYPHTAQYGGRSALGSYYFATQNSGALGLTSKLETVTLSNDVTSINNYALSYLKNLKNITMSNAITSMGQASFYYCSNLELTALPSSLTTLGMSAFTYCSKLAITQIPSGVTYLNNITFAQCTSLKKISMSSVTTIASTVANNGAFYACSGLKQVWIGSAITNSGLARYSFQGCNALEKIYIDLPRATVQSFTNYQYAFMNDTSKTGIIVCNDDSGWINKTTFDNLVIS